MRLARLPRRDFGYGLRAFRIGKEKRLFCSLPVFYSANTYSKTTADIPALKLLHLTAIIGQSTVEVRKIKVEFCKFLVIFGDIWEEIEFFSMD